MEVEVKKFQGSFDRRPTSSEGNTRNGSSEKLEGEEEEVGGLGGVILI
jgi:hypothetical protein